MKRADVKRARAAALVLLLLAACGEGGAAHDHSAAPGAEHTDGSEDVFAFGAAADPAGATRTIEVTASDYAFSPSDLDVRVGEIVKFRITNDGNALHEFMLGDEATHAEHETDATTADAHGHEAPYMVMVRPGESATLAWYFNTEGEFDYVCHIADHEDRGMRGTIHVTR